MMGASSKLEKLSQHVSGSVKYRLDKAPFKFNSFEEIDAASLVPLRVEQTAPCKSLDPPHTTQQPFYINQSQSIDRAPENSFHTVLV